jgi:hypothetical protein
MAVAGSRPPWLCFIPGAAEVRNRWKFNACFEWMVYNNKDASFGGEHR